MDRENVTQWIARYERAWRDGDLDAVGDIFSADAHYRASPYENSMIGHAAIRAFWPDDEDVFTMSASPVAVEGRDAVVRVEVRYGDPVRQEYRDLWVLRFDDGRVEDFEEWAYWPDKPVHRRGLHDLTRDRPGAVVGSVMVGRCRRSCTTGARTRRTSE